MEEFIEEFLIIWNNNVNLISEHDKFLLIIDKLSQKSILEIQDKKLFIALLELMADTIYEVNHYADKYEGTYYQQTTKYEESELNCCSNLINYLESELERDLENEYDIAYTKSLQNTPFI
jgi:hypothetical protein